MTETYRSYNEDGVGYIVDLVTGKIEFRYPLCEDGRYETNLLSQCRDDIQIIIKEMLAEDEITLGILETEDDYFNVVNYFNGVELGYWDDRIVLIVSRITGDSHYEIHYWENDDLVIEKIWGYYDEAEYMLQYLESQGKDIFRQKERRITR